MQPTPSNDPEVQLGGSREKGATGGGGTGGEEEGQEGEEHPLRYGLNNMEKKNAVIGCRTGELWFLDDQGCEIKPKGNRVHLQMEKCTSGHWFLPVGRFSDAMQKMAVGHLATTSATPGDQAAAKAATSASPAASSASAQ